MAKKVIKHAKKGESIAVNKNTPVIDVQTSKVTFFGRQNCNITDLANVKFAAPENIKTMDISFNQIKT